MTHVHKVAVQADARGRLLLPKEVRAHLGLQPKSTISVETQSDGSVVLRDAIAQRRRLLAEARGSLRGQGGTVDELISERRAAAKRELTK